MTSAKPLAVDQAEYWRTIELPDAWTDQYTLKLPRYLFMIFSQLFSGKVRKIQLPDDLPGVENIPKYVLQEFHSLPNGNYSKHIAQGYARSFDATMLNTVKRKRIEMAQRFTQAKTALDLGCGGGHMAQALIDAGVQEVWGIEPSPYLIQIAAKNHPDLKLIQGVAETCGLPDNCMDVVSASFFFHEIPPRYADQILQEMYRIIKPGGHLFFIEPSPIHFFTAKWPLFKQYGLKGLYFRLVSSHVFDPFVKAWHAKDLPQWLASHGFDLIEDNNVVPLRTVLCQRRD